MSRTRTITITVALAALIALAAVVLLHHSSNSTRPAASTVAVYTEEDLSGPSLTEPVSALSVSRSAGWVCYANLAGSDTQLYIGCNTFAAAGGHVAAAS